MSEIEQFLPDFFCCINRNLIVNTKKISPINAKKEKFFYTILMRFFVFRKKR
ncbi:MAG: hypothetical protein LBU51_03480 [Bacteroidales bacterium]|nr:hypothetical protein [Bacteroidales bacterium]